MTDEQFEGMKLVGLVLLGVLTVLGLLASGLRRRGRYYDDMVSDFVRYFPGVCMICSYYRYGVSHGFIGSEHKPPPHHCIEERHDSRQKD